MSTKNYYLKERLNKSKEPVVVDYDTIERLHTYRRALDSKMINLPAGSFMKKRLFMKESQDIIKLIRSLEDRLYSIQNNAEF